MSPAPPARTPHTRASRVLLRGIAKHCPRCGRGGLFTRWFDLGRRCPNCGLPFERGEGYWLGAMAINLGVAELSFFAAFIAGMAITWPDVPWVMLTIVCVAVNIVVPIVFYPYSKTIFLAFDLIFHRMDPAWAADPDDPEPEQVDAGPGHP